MVGYAAEQLRDVFISEFVIAEARLGYPDAISRRLEVIADLMELQATEEVQTLGQELIRRNALPANAKIDAYHVAITTVNGMEYILTWNCTHIANAHTRPKMRPLAGHLVTNRLLSVLRKN